MSGYVTTSGGDFNSLLIADRHTFLLRFFFFFFFFACGCLFSPPRLGKQHKSKLTINAAAALFAVAVKSGANES